MTYLEALSYIHSRPKLSKKLGNDALKEILSKLGSPEKELKFVHVAGTNGKGSVCAMTDSVLRECGYKTGLFTSPFIERFNERIKVNGEDIPDAELAEHTDYVKSVCEKNNIELSEFALIFVIALVYFVKNKCDIIVLETGLGGRLDATNAIQESLVSVITSISYDHMQYLGDTIESIAGEKFGIIKENGTVIVYPDIPDNLYDIGKNIAKGKNAQIIKAEKLNSADGKIIYEDQVIELSLKGKHQIANASVSICILEALSKNGFTITSDKVIAGLTKTVWPGRLEWIAPGLILDGCHNEEGAQAFSENAKSIEQDITVVTGVMADKEYDKVAKILSSVAKRVIVTAPDIPRALAPEEYAKYFENYVEEIYVVQNPIEAVEKALGFDGVCAVCGSLYLVGEIRSHFKSQIE